MVPLRAFKEVTGNRWGLRNRAFGFSKLGKARVHVHRKFLLWAEEWGL